MNIELDIVVLYKKLYNTLQLYAELLINLHESIVVLPLTEIAPPSAPPP